MNDVKISNVVPVSPPAGGSAGIASSAPQPSSTPAKVDDYTPSTVSKTDSTESVKKSGAGQQVQQNQPTQKAQVQEAVAKLNDFIQSVQRNLEFNLDEDAGRVVVKVIDRQTKEVVRQIPDEVVLKLARDLQSDEPLSLFNTKA